jgi:hypothetical protein
LPVEVPTGEERLIVATLHVGEGSFKAPLEMYVEDNGALRTVPLTVRGRGVAHDRFPSADP